MENKRKLLESILFLENNPISLYQLEEIMDMGSLELSAALSALQQNLKDRDSALEIEYLEDRIYLKPKSDFMEVLINIYGDQERRRFSKASLEVLSIVAWKQPVTRSEIEGIRGVDSSNSVRNLIENDFVKVVGKRESLGRPQTYGTTEKFLKYFGLSSIDELPKIEDLKEIYE